MGRNPPPDILILFEARIRLDRMLADLRRAGFAHQLAHFREDNYGLAVAARLTGVKIDLESIGDPDLPVMLVRGQTRAASIAFTLVAAHPPPPLGAELAAARNRQLAALAEFTNRQPAANRILAGDLNVTPWSSRFRSLLDSAGLRNAQFDRGHLGTFPAFGLPSFLALPIDHTLVSPDVRVLARSVGPGLRLGSDHRPVETVLQLSRCE
jgi:endonuclease/exonuclease/phosphatase family metal-dependent hydrolase